MMDGWPPLNIFSGFPAFRTNSESSVSISRTSRNTSRWKCVTVEVEGRSHHRPLCHRTLKLSEKRGEDKLVSAPHSFLPCREAFQSHEDEFLCLPKENKG